VIARDGRCATDVPVWYLSPARSAGRERVQRGDRGAGLGHGDATATRDPIGLSGLGDLHQRGPATVGSAPARPAEAPSMRAATRGAGREQ